MFNTWATAHKGVSSEHRSKTGMFIVTSPLLVYLYDHRNIITMYAVQGCRFKHTQAAFAYDSQNMIKYVAM